MKHVVFFLEPYKSYTHTSARAQKNDKIRWKKNNIRRILYSQLFFYIFRLLSLPSSSKVCWFILEMSDTNNFDFDIRYLFYIDIS